jgi:small subunit ribosomal protein S1
MVSHAKVWEQNIEEEKEAARKEAGIESDNTKKAVKISNLKLKKQLWEILAHWLI